MPHHLELSLFPILRHPTFHLLLIYMFHHKQQSPFVQVKVRYTSIEVNPFLYEGEIYLIELEYHYQLKIRLDFLPIPLLHLWLMCD